MLANDESEDVMLTLINVFDVSQASSQDASPAKLANDAIKQGANEAKKSYESVSDKALSTAEDVKNISLISYVCIYIINLFQVMFSTLCESNVGNAENKRFG